VSRAWVAASVRSRALARRRLGPAGARRIAASASADEAIALLAETSYGHDVRAGDTMGQAQHALGGAVLWNLRVLGGWVPRSGVAALRALAAAFEVANIDEHLRSLHGEVTGPTYRLGSFATAWPRLVATTNVHDLRQVLATSEWGDPGSDGSRTVGLYLRMTWLARVARTLPMTSDWLQAAAALIVAREWMLGAAGIPDTVGTAAEPLLGSAWREAPRSSSGVPELATDVAWVFAGVAGPADLWRAEARFWRHVEGDAFTLLRGSSFDIVPTACALALLAADAWRVRAALETAAGRHDDLGLFDAVA
jgi:hypothetical protein